MRIALVSPYSWTYPGGVTRHIDALAGQLRRDGNEVNILAPFDPDDALARRLHHGAAPHHVEPPEGFVSLGRTIGVPANGAVSNLAPSLHSVRTLRTQLRRGGYDVAHIHEPVAPMVSWDALCSTEGLPLVGTFHSYSENVLTNGVANLLGASRRMNHLHVRIAVSEAAAWTARRFFGGRYTIVPNGVHVEDELPDSSPQARPLRILFIGQAVERKGLPVLLSAFEALREQVPATLTLVGSGPEHVAPLLLEDRGVRALGKVDEQSKIDELRQADVLCAPSLGGESFGMVLTEAFAAGVPVVASDIPGYRDVVRDGREGTLVAPNDPVALGQALRAMALDSDRRALMARTAHQSAQRFGWPQVAGEVAQCYERAMSIGTARSRRGRLAVRYGFASADLEPRQGRVRQCASSAHKQAHSTPARAPAAAAAAAATAATALDATAALALAPEPALALAASPSPSPSQSPQAVNRTGRPPSQPANVAAMAPRTSAVARVPRRLRRLALGVSALVAAGLVAGGLVSVGALHIAASIAASEPSLLIAGLGLMCGAMLVRGLAWHAILAAAPTWRRARLRDVLHATCIGVLMSATLPARMGEPARALIVSRRLGRTRETLPVVLGTVISQMLLNLVAVGILAVVTLTTVKGLQGDDTPLVVLAVTPFAVLLVLLVAPVVVPGAPCWRPLGVGDFSRELRAALSRVRYGMRVFSNVRQAPLALALQLVAWAIQWLCCWLLLAAFGLTGQVDLAGAAAVLFAVNLTALLPVTPANVGVFQVAVAAVLVGVYNVSPASAIAYGILLQAVEIAAALGMGIPALAAEGISWRELRVRTLHATPVRLDPLPAAASPGPAARDAVGAAARA